MNLLHLEYFREVANNEHVQKTGEKLHVSPSAISAGIRNLEQELGVQLFDRVGRNMKLNQFGRQFLPYVEEAFEALQRGVKALNEAQEHAQHSVSFSLLDAALWNKIFMHFSASNPNIRIRQISRDPDRQGKLMYEANLDFIVTDIDLENNALDHCTLFTDSLVLAVAKNHPLAHAHSEPQSIFQFQDELFLFRPKSDYFQQAVDKVLSQIGFDPARKMECEYMLRHFVFEKGSSVIITTKRTLQSELSEYAACIQIKEFAPFSLVKKLYWKKDVPLSSGAIKFKEFLLQAIDEQEG